MNFIYKKEDINLLCNDTLVLIPIIDSGIHYVEDKLILIFIYSIEKNNFYVLNIKHQDFPLYGDKDIHIKSKQCYCVGKKTLVYKNIIPIDALDMNFIIYPINHKKFNLYDYIPVNFLLYRNRFTSWEIYPASIILQMCFNINEYIMSLIHEYNAYLDDISMIDKLYYNSLFKMELNSIVYDGDIVYSDYNPYTMTNRPTNSSYNINLSAISKKDGKRRKLIPVNKDNSVLVQFDYSSFHVYLLAMMLNINLPKESDIYIELNKMYNFSPSTDRKSIKLDFFKFVYGTKEYNNDFSKILNVFINKLYDEFKLNGNVVSFFLNRRIFFNVDKNIEKHKLFNYYLQNAETEYNLMKILKLKEVFMSDECKLLLYVYDSFLLETDKQNTNIIETIKNTLQSENIPVTVQGGDNYQDLVDIY